MKTEAVSRGLSRRPAAASFLLRKACIAAGQNRLYFSGAVWYNILYGSFSNQRFSALTAPANQRAIPRLVFALSAPGGRGLRRKRPTTGEKHEAVSDRVFHRGMEL